MATWTPEEKDLLKSNFDSMGREELLRLLPLHTYRGIKQQAIRWGLVKLPTVQELRELVQAGYSMRALGRKYDLDSKTIHYYCRKYGIELPTQAEAASRANSKKIPKHLFIPPLDANMSWLLGIIASDGNISDAGHVRVASIDEDIPQQCLNVAGVGAIYERAPATRTRQRHYIWSYKAKKIAGRLAHFDIVPRKTHTLRLADLEEVHPPSYVRGLWDGDGHWRVDNRGYLRAGIGSASRDFIAALWEYLKPIVHSNANFYKHASKEHWVIRVDKRRAHALAAWMYQDPCDVYCRRKREIALSES